MLQTTNQDACLEGHLIIGLVRFGPKKNRKEKIERLWKYDKILIDKIDWICY